MEMDFRREWYGPRAKIIDQTKDYIVVDYGCQGRGRVTNYFLFDGIQLCFLDFDTTEVMPSQNFHPDILQFTYCREGRYECEFANHTVSYLPEGWFGAAGTKYLPVSFSFPLKKCQAVSLVIDRQALSMSVRGLMSEIPLEPERIGDGLEVGKRWYVGKPTEKLKRLFLELYEEENRESAGYFRIKAMELLYHISRLTQEEGCSFHYFDKRQIETVKEIRNCLVAHLDERLSLERLAKEAHLNVSAFHMIFSYIYGDTPYAYLKKYKMNLAAQMLLKKERKISDIALELGYSNASKFASAFESVYGILPKDYRKNK